MTMSANAQDTPGLAPSTPWNLHYDTDSCALRRMFGDSDRQVFLELRRFERTPRLQATVTSNWALPRNSSSVGYQFAADGEWVEFDGLPITADGGFRGVLFSLSLITLPDLDDVDDSRERATRLASFDWQGMERGAATKAVSLTLRGAFNRRIVMQTGSLAAPLEALNQCVNELMGHWGIDLEAHKTLTRPAVPINLPKVARMINYPPRMLQQSMPGVVNIRLSIDEQGGITGCHIQMPISDPAFEKSSCADLRHSLAFEPALDKDGKPIASYWITSVIFKIAR
jgi:hypothetical protein